MGKLGVKEPKGKDEFITVPVLCARMYMEWR
jgi:hypothetical protein